MQVNLLTVVISMVVGFGAVYLVTGQIQWGIVVGLLIGVGSAKWIRVKKHEARDEIEYDERVNNNIKSASFQTFSIGNLLLLIYLLLSELFFNEYSIKTNYLITYLSIIFILSYYIIPLLVKRK